MATAAETLSSTPAAQPNAAPASGNGSGAWYDSFQDQEVKSWAANKKYESPEILAKSAWSNEKLFGAEKAGRTVMLPKDDNDAEGWKALTAKLGVPANAEEYKLPVPQGQSEDFAKTAASWFHEAGIPPKMGKAVAEKWNDWMASQIEAGKAADKAESEKQMAGLEKEWGGEFTQKRELAQRGYRDFAKQFGLDDNATMERAESVLGAANLTKLFAGLGALNSESKFAASDGKGTFGMSTQAAQERVNQITADRAAGKINDHAWRTQFEPEMSKLAQIISQGA